MVNLSVDDLTHLIKNCVALELQKFTAPNSQSTKQDSDELLSRVATGKLLGVSMTTLFHWNNDDILPAKKIGGRVFYLKSEVMSKFNNVA